MALNYTVSYTFASNTTISSSQVNTNFSDNSNTWSGLEALTKTMAKLKVDVDPATALEVATKQYVDHYASYRRPVLQYSSGTVVLVETGLTGTAGQILINFPDGTQRTDSTAGRIQCNLAQNAVLSGSTQGGLRSGAQTSNTWYSFYAVKSQSNSTDIIIVADSVPPIQANFATLNANFGTSAWVYLGSLPNGDNSAFGNIIPAFSMSGNVVTLWNSCTLNHAAATPARGIRLTTTASATTLSWSYAAGTVVGNNFPANIVIGYIAASIGGGTQCYLQNAAGSNNYLVLILATAGAYFLPIGPIQLTQGFKQTASAATTQDIVATGYIDGALGVGSNPLL